MLLNIRKHEFNATIEEELFQLREILIKNGWSHKHTDEIMISKQKLVKSQAVQRKTFHKY